MKKFWGYKKHFAVKFGIVEFKLKTWLNYFQIPKNYQKTSISQIPTNSAITYQEEREEKKNISRGENRLQWNGNWVALEKKKKNLLMRRMNGIVESIIVWVT